MTSACKPYSLANMKEVMDCGIAACKRTHTYYIRAKIYNIY